MKRPFTELTKSEIEYRLDQQRERVAATVKRALNYLNDPEKSKRHQEQYCLCCYYSEGTMAGAALTESQCGICEKEMKWSSTHQEVLCLDCAKQYRLCRECGSTIDYKDPRHLKQESFRTKS